MAKKVTTYQEDLVNALKDPHEAAAYLNAAIEEGDRAVFLLALRNVAEAQGGMTALARGTAWGHIFICHFTIPPRPFLFASLT